MYTVYIKCGSVNHGCYLNADLIESIYHFGDKITANALLVKGSSDEVEYTLYAGKSVNAEDAVSKILHLIHKAKETSSKEKKSVILDFSKGLDFYVTSFNKGYANTFEDAIKIEGESR